MLEATESFSEIPPQGMSFISHLHNHKPTGALFRLHGRCRRSWCECVGMSSSACEIPSCGLSIFCRRCGLHEHSSSAVGTTKMFRGIVVSSYIQTDAGPFSRCPQRDGLGCQLLRYVPPLNRWSVHRLVSHRSTCGRLLREGREPREAGKGAQT